jgi:predicted dehydrogenase
VYGVDARLVAVTSPTADRREAFAKETGTAAFPTLAAMLPHVDVVDVCSPPASHEPVALEAIDAGKHVVIEKPFTGAFDKASGADALLKAALGSADRITHAARRRRVVLAYAENWIYASRTAARIHRCTASGSTRGAAPSSARAVIPSPVVSI